MLFKKTKQNKHTQTFRSLFTDKIPTSLYSIWNASVNLVMNYETACDS